VEEALLMVPVLSSDHTVVDPNPAVNSWAPYSWVWLVTEPDQVKVIVEDPVVVTLPYQISSSPPMDPSNCTALLQVLTPPPEIDDTVTVLVDVRAETSSTSPVVWGSTAKVVRPDPTAVARLPTDVMVTPEDVKVK